MKIHFVKWFDCTGKEQFMLISEHTESKARKRFDKWCEDNPDKAPTAYSFRSAELKDLLHLNETK